MILWAASPPPCRARLAPSTGGASRLRGSAPDAATTRLCLYRKQHSTQLEANSYNTPADFLVMLIVSGAALLVMGAFMGMPFLGMGLVFSIVYVWAKENADQEVNFVMNLAKFKAFYLPWAYVGLAMLMGQSPVPHLMGIAAGHFYVFLDKIVPVQYNRTVLWTPNFLCAIPSASSTPYPVAPSPG
jgi:hypothetical protein